MNEIIKPPIPYPKDGQMTWNNKPFEPSKPYSLLIKHKGFDPSPVAGKIPFFANSLVNPDCVGSSLWEEWWEEQHDRNVNGYYTGGQWIPGRYYFYLNFNPLTGLAGNGLPFYCDFDLEWFYTVEQIKKYHMKGLLEPKARRKGASEKGTSVINHGLRYIEGYKAGVAAGIVDYVVGFRTKLEPNITTLKIPEMYLGTLVNDDKEIKIGYEVKRDGGTFTPDGYGGQIRFATMYDNPKKLEGEYFHDVILEESGHFPKLGEVIGSIDPALMFGATRMGMFYVYGTGGNVMSGSKEFRRLWYNAEKEGFVKLFIPGKRIYPPFIGGQGDSVKLVNPLTGFEIDPIKNLRHLEPHQRIGCEDTVAAKQYIDDNMEHLRTSGNRKEYIAYKKANPDTPEEAFESGGSNNFNNDKLYEQKNFIATNDKLYLEWVLEFEKVKDNLGRMVNKLPLNVIPRPATDKDPQWMRVKILNNGHPIKGLLNLDVGGCDSYNQDQTNTSDSLGGICVVRQGDKVPHTPGVLHGRRYPICIYSGRPPRKEQFYDMALAVAVYYDLRQNMMLSAEYDLIIKHFEKNGGKRYIAPRPRSFDSPNTQAEYKWGVKMNSYNKPLMVGLMQTDIEDNCDVNYFEELLDNLIAYDELNIGDDWDLGDAYGYALMRCADMRISIRSSIEHSEEEPNVVFKERYDPAMGVISMEVVTLKENFDADDLFNAKIADGKRMNYYPKDFSNENYN